LGANARQKLARCGVEDAFDSKPGLELCLCRRPVVGASL